MDYRDFFTRMALKFGPAIIIIAGFVSILLGVIFHATTIDEDKYQYPKAKTFDEKVVIGSQYDDNLIWFLQITDLHLSNRGSFDREIDFKDFTRKYLDIIKPDAVLATGDLTDGRTNNSILGTSQQIDEWQAYYGAVVDSNATSKTNWLDIRGNHDNFNVYRPSDPKTYYRQYTVRGKLHERNYHFVLQKGTKNYSFIGVDEVQTPGLKVPFNFLGIVAEEDLEELERFKEYSIGNHSEYNTWFAHYPSSSIYSPSDGLRHIIDGPYLCGHYHTIGNLVTKMQASQQTGYVELELGDWKHNRMLRLAAIDHQLFSMVDFKYNQFPIALMTNPKAAEHVMPKYEPIERIAKSTHMRVLAFSNSSITKVQISIDDSPEYQDMIHEKGPLYVKPWNQDDYSHGLHKVKLLVTDVEGKSLIYNQTFSLDNSREDYPILAKLLLRLYFRTSVMSLFYFVVSVCTLPLLIMKFIRYDHSHRRQYKAYTMNNLQILSNVPRIAYPLLLIPIWICVGPLFIGYMIDESIGICFTWGVLIDNRFIHTGLTYNVGSIFLLIIHIPELILLSSQTGSAYKFLLERNTTRSIHNLRIYIHIMVTIIQLGMGSLLLGAYGKLAYITSFNFIWCTLIYSYSWYQCSTLKKADFFEKRNSVDQEEQPLTSQSSTRGEQTINSESQPAI